MQLDKNSTSKFALVISLAAALTCGGIWPLSKSERAQAKDSNATMRSKQGTEARSLLKKMHDNLRSRRDLQFTASLNETDTVLGQKLTGTANFSIRQPNLFRVEVTRSGQRTIFVSDGKTLSIYKPKKRKFARVPAQDSVLGTMYSAAGLMNIPGRILDFFWTVDYLAKFDEAVRSEAIPSARLAGRTCQGIRVVRMQDRFDIWMDPAFPHLPCKLISRRTDGAGEVVFTNVFKWTKSPDFERSTFVFSPPAGVREAAPLDLE